MGFPGGASGKEPTCQCRRCERRGFNRWVGKILWRRAWQPTPIFLPGESQGQRSLVGYSPRGHKESDMTEATLHTHTHTHMCNVQKSTVEGLRERYNKAEEGCTEEMTLEPVHRSRGSLVGKEEGERACQAQERAGIEVRGMWATAPLGTGW